MSSIMLQRICTTYAPIVARDCGNERGDVKTTPTTRGLSGKWPRWMTRGTGREARTQASPICRHIGDAEDAASRPVTPVRVRDALGEKHTPLDRRAVPKLAVADGSQIVQGLLEGVTPVYGSCIT